MFTYARGLKCKMPCVKVWSVIYLVDGKLYGNWGDFLYFVDLTLPLYLLEHLFKREILVLW